MPNQKMFKLVLLSIIFYGGEGQTQHLRVQNQIESNSVPKKRVKLSTLISQTAVPPNNDVTIPEDTIAFINRNITLGLIHVKGELRCRKGKSITLRSHGILVSGSGAELSCGTEAQPFLAGKVIFELFGNRDLNEIDSSLNSMGVKALVARDGGTLSLHGNKAKSGYTRLSSTMHEGSSVATLDDENTVQSWESGDQIVISTTSFYPDRNEIMTVDSVRSGGIIDLTDNVLYKHHGTNQIFTDNADGESFIVDERAYVANLIRNIVIQGDIASESDEIGAHVMIQSGGKSYVHGVEFLRVGQKSHVGRYPFHWHRVGDAAGQYIQYSSIHHSYHRCVTIHNTNQATVLSNTCVDHFGHGFFLEEGNEVRNILQGNLGIASKKIDSSDALLVSDFNLEPGDRFPGPATYWISNPDNDIRYNVAVGSEGSGFWMAFRKFLKCDEQSGGSGCTVVSNAQQANVFPLSTQTLHFSHNTAMSTVTGMTWDGAPDGAPIDNPMKKASGDFALVNAHYAPQGQVPNFDNLHVYKSARAGIYFRGQQCKYTGAVFADSATAAFFAYNQIIKDSIMVGLSANHDHGEFEYHFDNTISIHRRHSRMFEGIRVYDGPWVLDNVHFAGYSSDQIFFTKGRNEIEVTPTPLSLIGGAERFVNLAKRVTFEPNPYRRFFMSSSNNWQDSYSAATTDKNGDITGKPGYVIVPKHEMNYLDGCIDYVKEESYVCNYKVGHVRLLNGNGQNFDVSRYNGPSIDHSTSGPGNYLNKFSVIIADTMVYYQLSNIVLGNRNKIELLFSSDSVGDMSPIIQIQSMVNANCDPVDLKLLGATQVSFQELQVTTQMAYTIFNGMFGIRLKAINQRSNISPEAPQGTYRATLQCS